MDRSPQGCSGASHAPSVMAGVVFSQWRQTELAVTLGLVLPAARRQEWPRTCISVRCPSCDSEHIVTRGKTRRRTPRSLGQTIACTQGSLLLNYRNRGCVPEVGSAIHVMLADSGILATR